MDSCLVFEKSKQSPQASSMVLYANDQWCALYSWKHETTPSKNSKTIHKHINHVVSVLPKEPKEPRLHWNRLEYHSAHCPYNSMPQKSSDVSCLCAWFGLLVRLLGFALLSFGWLSLGLSLGFVLFCFRSVSSCSLSYVVPNMFERESMLSVFALIELKGKQNEYQIILSTHFVEHSGGCFKENVLLRLNSTPLSAKRNRQQ